VLLTIGSFIVVIGVLIFVHEAGHFLAAKAVGIQVLRFSLGFGRPLVSWKRGETEYWISWLPLGGYVKMAGLEDEGMAGELEGGTSPVPVDPARAFDKQPLWARVVVILAGVTMNAIFAFVAFTTLAATVGVPRIATTQVDTVLVSELPPGAEPLRTLHRGDRIVAVGDARVTTWEDFMQQVVISPGPVRIAVAGRPEPLVLNVGRPGDETRAKLVNALLPLIPPVIRAVEPGPAQQAGLRPRDRIIRVDGDTIVSFTQVRAKLRSSPGRPLHITVARGDTVLTLVVKPEKRTERDPRGDTTVAFGYAGIGSESPVVREKYSLLRAAPAGWGETVKVTGAIAHNLKLLLTGQISLRAVGGPIGIGQQSGEAARGGIEVFIQFMAIMSLNLAVLNLLPIPVLDGGQLVFLVAEGVRRRPLSLQLRLRLTQVGFVVIIALMLLATSNDLIRILGNVFSR
jgi:regulator of sigma E protease